MTDPDFVNSLARGLDVLSAFEKGHRKVTLTAVAQRTGLPRGTARRFLRTLCTLGYLATDEKLYWLTPKVLKFHSNYLATFGLGEAAYSHIQKLTEVFDETSSMSVLDDHEIVYVARVEQKRVYSNRIEIGTRLPAHSTSMGLVLLSGMSEGDLDSWINRAELTKFTDNTVTDKKALKARVLEAKKQGYAMIDGALEIGVRSLSAPIHDREEQVVAAINIVTFAGKMSGTEMIDRFLPELLATSKKISMIVSNA